MRYDFKNEDALAYVKSLPSASIDLFLTDPPYAISRETNFQSGVETGTERTMYAKTGIKRHLSKKPNKRKVSNVNNDIMRVFDCESKSYKSFKLGSVLSFRCGKVILK